MNPQTANKLASEVPEIKEFISYIKGQIKLLNTVSDIRLDDPIELAVEVKGRQNAITTLLEILSPLVNGQDISINRDNEYAVE